MITLVHEIDRDTATLHALAHVRLSIDENFGT